ncbi:hypothetical protein GH714_015291 [Hevea brasiliensis]|uniref:Plastocyanin-like domain-containing protein n=1 Tax=Hevea brasiliensis TaxID=3981 RepID=A0A6A6KRP5_HEVBR|nr:hypothetical protein GH714_015291 [Hevea brasiliensis]
MPQTALLQAHYFNLTGVFRTDFPDKPPTPFNYTGAPLTASLGTVHGTKPSLSKIAFNSTVELVLQDTNLLTVESHPFHLHGYNFFVVGTGIGNFDPVKTLLNITWLIPLREIQLVFLLGDGLLFGLELTIQVYKFELIKTPHWLGTEKAFVVEDGPGPDQSILPPPKDLPAC